MKRLTYLLFGLLLLSSCEQDASFIVKDGHTKIFAFSEITTDNKVKVIVNIAPGLNTEDEYFYPKQQDATVQLMQDGVILDNPGFRYISREKAFISQGSWRPEAGVEYGLVVSMKKDMDVKPITGTTVIPDHNFIERYFVDEFRTAGAANQKMDFEIDISIPLNETSDKFFVLKPFYRNVDGEREELLIKEVTQGEEGSYYSPFNEGLLVDLNKVGDEIKLTLTNQFQVPRTLKVKEINFELMTITGDAYNYYKSFSKQVASQSVSLSEPVISFTNFENGLGLFTGYASTINAIKL